MTQRSSAGPATFDQKRASNYDERIRWGIPGYTTLHELVLDVLSEALSERARVLIAGAGTGMEVATLGAAKPGWRFTAVDPSAPMLEALRSRLKDTGLTDRATVVNGLVRDLPASESVFDAATSILISHFIEDLDERTAYFKSIAERLRPGAPLVFADIHGDRKSEAFRRLFSIWKTRCLRSPMDRGEVEALFSRMDTDIGIIPESTLMALVEKAGFEHPVAFWRGHVFGGWITRRRP